MKLKYIIIVLIIIILLSAIPFYLYTLNFGGGFSTNKADWGTFGDFIGGILNPILALLNIIAFLYLTHIIHEFDRKSREHELNYQRKIIYSGEKYELFKKINHSVNKIRFILLSNIEKKSDAITDLFENCDSSIADIKLLFPEINISDIESKEIQDRFLKLIKEVQYVEIQKSTEFSNAFGFSKLVIQFTNVLLLKIKDSIENDLKTK